MRHLLLGFCLFFLSSLGAAEPQIWRDLLEDENPCVRVLAGRYAYDRVHQFAVLQEKIERFLANKVVSHRFVAADDKLGRPIVDLIKTYEIDNETIAKALAEFAELGADVESIESLIEKRRHFWKICAVGACAIGGAGIGSLVGAPFEGAILMMGLSVFFTNRIDNSPFYLKGRKHIIIFVRNEREYVNTQLQLKRHGMVPMLTPTSQ